MAGALGVAERLLALEAAVAEIRGELRMVAAGGTSTGGSTQPKTRSKSRPAADVAAEDAGSTEVVGADGSAVELGEGEEPAGPERLAQVLGNARLTAVLVRAGYDSPEAVAAAPDEDLLAVDGVSERALRLIRARLA